MKMNYPLKNSNFEERRRNARKRVLVIVIILVLAIAVMMVDPVRQIFFSLAKPIWKLENVFLNSNLIGYIKSKQVLMDEKIAMEQKLFLAGNLLALNQTLQNENDSLKDLLGRKDIKQKTVLSAILVKPPQTPYDILTIDIGTDSGIKVGDKVLALGNVYIGEVSEVYSTTAKVTLYSTPGRKLPVALGTNSVSAEAVGIGGSNFSIFLPREVEVKENDVIVIPSITPNVFGIVEKINYKDKDSFQTVIFKSPVNISELNFVEVII
jgi:cell shape-determining protein MreC